MKGKCHYPKGLKPVQINKSGVREVVEEVQEIFVGEKRRRR
jgi:hypothetical protein